MSEEEKIEINNLKRALEEDEINIQEMEEQTTKIVEYAEKN